jgi:hypothetical protein
MAQLRAQHGHLGGAGGTLGAGWAGFLRAPTLLWFLAPGQEEAALELAALAGAFSHGP